ncbi:MAG: AraC family transcriptional regulator [Cellvibrionaceae bacterium]
MRSVLPRWMLLGVVLALLTSLAQGQVIIGGESESGGASGPPSSAAPSMPGEALANPTADQGGPAKPLSDQVEALKDAVLDLNRDLLILEEELLFPANTQVAIFLSMDVGEFFHLDSVKVQIDDELVASDLYTPQQADALFRGGVQRLFVGNLRSGSHVVTAFFTGIGPEGREYKRGATVVLEKELAPKMLELRIVDSTRKLQPVFDIKEWEL